MDKLCMESLEGRIALWTSMIHLTAASTLDVADCPYHDN
ncbi:hypothetical protein SAMN05192539_102891 [Paraburkholderia diazotrophica]|uniref:Uncharacterized protein n=1 Tax=Paraburkholderia diazotrophica TaxID=667676 RepID=A0A1H6U4P6_9BURK|nr:hypothetical protein SAMN05192539_1004348 [Paraburkholderia diazotrophica]SEJ99555.1 hypothetical protein SAMN05192539_102891 [Paraburkholderia diazotrophica]